MRRALMLLAVGTFVLNGPLADRARALSVQVALTSDDFALAVGNYYSVPHQQVLTLRDRGLPIYEAPVALTLAHQVQVEPLTVVDMRLRGSSWQDVYDHHGVHPDVFYVPVEEPLGPYERLYQVPRDEWDTLVLSDAEYVEMANLSFVSRHYGYAPVEVVRLRSSGSDFLTIAGLVARTIDLAARQSYPGSTGTELVGAALGSFLYAVATGFDMPGYEVYLLPYRGLAFADIPVALTLARRARVAPLQIVDLRLKGRSWHDVSLHYGLGAEAFYVPVRQVYGPYTRVYELFRRHPRARWNRFVLRDDEYVRLANLKMATRRWHTTPERVMRLEARRPWDSVRAHQVLRNERLRQRGLAPWRQPAIGRGEMRKLQGEGPAAIGRGEARKLGVQPSSPAERGKRAQRVARERDRTARSQPARRPATQAPRQRAARTEAQQRSTQATRQTAKARASQAGSKAGAQRKGQAAKPRAKARASQAGPKAGAQRKGQAAKPRAKARASQAGPKAGAQRKGQAAKPRAKARVSQAGPKAGAQRKGQAAKPRGGGKSNPKAGAANKRGGAQKGGGRGRKP
jgi:hypothetical protein